MYHKTDYNERAQNVPFRIECTNCGSHNVNVTAFDYYDLQISCNCCGSYLQYGCYNETIYNE